MATSRSSDAIASTEMHRSRGLGSTRLPSNTRAQRRVVDPVSDIGRSRLNGAFRIVGRHMAAPRDADQDRTGGISRSWDRGPRSSRNHGRPFFFSESDSPRFLCDILIRTGVLPLCKVILD